MLYLAIIWAVSLAYCIFECLTCPEAFEDPERGFVLGTEGPVMPQAVDDAGAQNTDALSFARPLSFHSAASSSEGQRHHG